MKVILLKSVPKVGKKDTVVEVASGYAQHSLFPKKLAIPATPSALESLNKTLANVVTEREIQHRLLDNAIAAIGEDPLIYKAKANEQGSLFSKVDETDVAQALMKDKRISIDPRIMKIKNAPIKYTGTYFIDVTDGTYNANFSVIVEKE